MNSKMLIIGNGPSTRELAEVGFENLRPEVDTFGMGAAYRYFRPMGWWPTLYACADSKVVFSHRDALASIIEDPEVTTERFYFAWPVVRHPRLEVIGHASTGDFCLRTSLELGYREVYLYGIEGQYVEEIAESRELAEEEYYELGFDRLGLSDSEKATLRIITATPAVNPNYFFEGYQQVGDVYSLPNSGIHRERWKESVVLAGGFGAQVVNLSAGSRVLDYPKTTLSRVADQLLVDADSAPHEGSGAASKESPIWFGAFDRQQEKRVDESDVVWKLFRSLNCRPANRKPVMIDVGACKGGAFRRFAEQGWVVHAFEPNPPLFEGLVEEFDSSNVTVNQSAVSDVEGEEIPLYTSEESIGITSLKPFRDTHELTAHVKTIRLDAYLRDEGLNHVDFLKIDAEGFDLMALKGADLGRYQSEVVVCEFEDRKTKPLGYSMDDMAQHLESFGYTVYVSEWHPVIRYGGPHQWRALKLYPCAVEEPDAWGNLLAFKTDPGIWSIGKFLGFGITTLDALQSRVRTLEQELEDLRRSTSWRITAPLRVARTETRRALRRIRGASR